MLYPFSSQALLPPQQLYCFQGELLQCFSCERLLLPWITNWCYLQYIHQSAPTDFWKRDMVAWRSLPLMAKTMFSSLPDTSFQHPGWCDWDGSLWFGGRLGRALWVRVGRHMWPNSQSSSLGNTQRVTLREPCPGKVLGTVAPTLGFLMGV